MNLFSSLGKPLGQLIPPALVISAFIGCTPIPNPNPPPVPSSLVTATKDYVKTLPDAYESVAQQILNGQLTTKTDVVNALHTHAQPLATALDDAFAPLIDDQGKIQNSTAAANVLDQVAKALKGN